MVDRFESIKSNNIELIKKYDMKSVICVKKLNAPIWVNNYEITLTKDHTFYHFSIEFSPKIGKENKFLKEKIFKQLDITKISKGRIKLFTGDSLFISVNKDDAIEKLYSFDYLYKSTDTEYTITFTQSLNSKFNLKSDSVYHDKHIHKMLYELMIQEVIKNNPNIEIYRRMFIKINDKKQILSDRTGLKLDFFPGFTTSVTILKEGGLFLTVALKNRFMSTKNCLELIKECKNKDEINEKFSGRSVKTIYSKKNYLVDSVDQVNNPITIKILYNGKQVNLIEYYKSAHAVTIKEEKQPLFLVSQRTAQGTEFIHLIPELVLLSGIDDNMVKDRDFMQNLATYTKFTPVDKVKVTSSFLSLLSETKAKTKTKKKGDTGKDTFYPSSKDTLEEFGLKVSESEKSVAGYQVDYPSILTKNTILHPDKLDRNPVHLCMIPTNKKVLVVYNVNNYNEADNLINLCKDAGKAYKLPFPEPEWVEVNTTRAEDYISAVNNSIKQGETIMGKFAFVLFIISNKTEFLYTKIKEHSLSNKEKCLGYISQVVKAETVKKGMSFASKLLVQINYKLKGYSFVLDINSNLTKYKQKELMLIGIDSSHISGKRTAVAMCATTNEEFSSFTNTVEIIEEKNKDRLCYSVQVILNQGLTEYFKINKKLPKGVVIYRQGVSLEQQEYLKEEISVVQEYLNGNDMKSVNKGYKIPFLYTLVNKKTNFKFFEKSGNTFNNPKGGLAIFKGATDGDKFEFFLQPQLVTQGTATPTHYEVIYGTLLTNEAICEILTKLTSDLCYLYGNWTGPVRVPHVLKNAEKLSKMASKSIKSGIHENVKNGLCYL